ncbi:MAG: alpha-2-macroglobulin, partial [Lentisphaeria bacterium]|nr:alpha-2-macroglobulin [Lentisphaeria bacterium]
FASAASDGERWRRLLQQAAAADPDLAHESRVAFAGFLHQQFGVQTMAAHYGRFFGGADADQRSGIYAVHTLKDSETIARLAVGIRRFELPDEVNYIRIYRELADGESGGKAQATLQLAQIYENRRQYPEAVTWWERYMAFDRRHAADRIAQITGNWGQFLPVSSQPAGTEAKVDLRFRNADRASLTAYRVEARKLVEDVRRYVRGKPGRLDWNRVNLGDIGRRLVWENQAEYITGKVADWDVALTPRPNHFDRTITITTPLKEAGVYLLVCDLPKGNTSRVLLMLDDTVIVRKPLDKQHLVYVADAVRGIPLRDVEVNLFGYRQEWVRNTRTQRILVEEKTLRTDAEGLLVLDEGQVSDQYTWLITATQGERFAFDGFTGIHYPQWYDEEYRAAKVFVLTDRPVYRPGNTVHWKAWLRQAQYDMGDESRFAGRTVRVEIRSPRDEKVFEGELRADAFGGISGELPLGEEAALGVYALGIEGPASGGGSFRVEEYKKPEFEVTVEAPTEPVLLGETVPAKVTAKYYFGAPVTKATVKVRILRHNHVSRWYPVMPWDWFYGPGYWWFAYDYDWYPGWLRWGCPRPAYWWVPWHAGPPEVVVDTERPIGPDGSVTVDIDTRPAQEIHGDKDHRYEITAEVRDESRRTIVGNGQVLVAREPYRVYAWVDRGHYRAGDTVRASFQARTLDGRGVPGTGRARLLAVTYGPERLPEERELQAWDLDTDADGSAALNLTASRPGQYRLSYMVTDAKGYRAEAGYVFVVRGDTFDGRDFRFSQVELVPDKAQYAAGERLELAVHSDCENGTVLLFVRPANGVAKPPRVLHLDGRSTVVTIDVSKRDMPNFYVEALTVFDGRVHSTIREIVVPPETRVLAVDVLPSAPRYKPAEKGVLRLRLTDATGEPYAGSAVVSVYDKSVEYIAGGTFLEDIRAFFWKWRRNHHEVAWDTLARIFHNLLKEKEVPMLNIGVFGAVPEEEGEGELRRAGVPGGMGGGRLRAAKGAPMLGMAMDAVAMEGAPMPLAAAAPPGAMVLAEGAAEGAGGMGAGNGGGAAGAPAPAVIRKEFADTAVWVAAVETGADGTAEVALPFPDNLTTWKIRVWAMGHGTRVGEGSAEVITSKNLLLRLQAPRFFVQKDEVVLSANVHNYLEAGKQVRAVLELDGPCLEVTDRAERALRLEAGGEERVDWRVRVLREGEAVVRMKALSDEESDAVEMRFPVYVHGMDKMVPVCGLLRPGDERVEIPLDVPRERRPEATRLEVRFSPSLAMAMIDALPYLMDYPYGCTEQTLNRFLPTVVTQNVLLRMGVSLEDIRAKRTNLNAQELGDAGDRARQWQRYNRNPVFDEAEVRAMVRQGIEALTGMQLSDGGWGWFSGWGERSMPHTTATIVHGLQVAEANGVALVPGVLDRGVAWLKGYQEGQIAALANVDKDGQPLDKSKPWKAAADNLDALVYMVLVDSGAKSDAMRDYLYRDRTKLAVYGLALYGLALEKQSEAEKLAMVMRNISQYVVIDNENQTAYLNMPEGFWWYWYGSEIEAQSYYIKLLVAANPQDPVAPLLVKYLVNNRKHATYWNSTRDTALAVEALADFILATGEAKPDMTVEVWIDGQKRQEVAINGDNLFAFDNRFILTGDKLEAGRHTIELRKRGTGPLYWNGYLTNFTLEDDIPAAGLELKVQRRFYKPTPTDKSIEVAGGHGQVVDQQVEKFVRTEIPNLG